MDAGMRLMSGVVLWERDISERGAERQRRDSAHPGTGGPGSVGYAYEVGLEFYDLYIIPTDTPEARGSVLRGAARSRGGGGSTHKGMYLSICIPCELPRWPQQRPFVGGAPWRVRERERPFRRAKERAE